MAQERIRKSRRTTADRKPQETEQGRQEVRQDVRRTWWPEA